MIARNSVRVFLSHHEPGFPDRRFASVPGVDDYSLVFLYAADELGVFDAISDGPKSLLDIGARLGVNVHLLGRIFRVLADQDFLLESPDGRFALVDMDLMHRISLSKSVQIDPLLIQATGKLVDAMRHGGIPFHRVYSANLIPFVCG
jgi:hypothetical protein